MSFVETFMQKIFTMLMVDYKLDSEEAEALTNQITIIMADALDESRNGVPDESE